LKWLLLTLAAVEWSAIDILAVEIAGRLKLLGGLKWLVEKKFAE
jgi:hypothetical protein